MLQQSIITDEFDEYLPVNSIQPGAPIEFLIKSADNLDQELDKSGFIVTAKITKAIGNDMDANVQTELVNLMLHSMFRKISATLNDTPASDPNPLYPYRGFIEIILNYSKETQKTHWYREAGQKTRRSRWRSPNKPVRTPVWSIAPLVSPKARPSSSSIVLTSIYFTKVESYLQSLLCAKS